MNGKAGPVPDKPLAFGGLRRKIVHTLSGKLILAIGISMFVVGSIFWFFLTRYQDEELLNNNVSFGLFFAEHIIKSTHYGMLHFDRDLIQKNIRDIGAVKGVMKIRIFNDKCTIKHSSQPEEVGAALDKKSAVCQGCHASTDGPRRDALKWVLTKDDSGRRVLNVIEPIYNEPDCFNAECHFHDRSQKTLGMVEADILMSMTDLSIKKQRIAIAAFVISFAGVISLALYIILWKFVSRPVALLVDGMEKAGRGTLDHRVQIKSNDEMGALADAFNAMLVDMKTAKEYLLNWTTILEDEVLEKTEEIRKSHAHLIRTEKLASLGRMAAGVAHEINNPLTGIVTFAHLLHKRAEPGSPEQKDLEVIIEQANRCTKIIKGLLGFARAADSEKVPTNANEVLNSSIQMVSGKADFLNIRFSVNTDDALASVRMDPSQIQQVFLNIFFNAADAMDGKGTITVTTRQVVESGRSFVEVELGDTGPGIKEENVSKIFEPFFTTKPVGKGTGLGLAVCYGILEEHGGSIRVTSTDGGANFFVRLPVAGE